jgi:DNA-binding NarL/FixJ family response regulator
VHTGTTEKVRILQSVVSEFDFTKVDSFSGRERQLFDLLGDGRSMSDIADRMSVSVKTVETYRARIKVKLDVANGLQIVRLATEWKLLHRTNDNAATTETPGG